MSNYVECFLLGVVVCLIISRLMDLFIEKVDIYFIDKQLKKEISERVQAIREDRL